MAGRATHMLVYMSDILRVATPLVEARKRPVCKGAEHRISPVVSHLATAECMARSGPSRC